MITYANGDRMTLEEALLGRLQGPARPGIDRCPNHCRHGRHGECCRCGNEQRYTS